MARLVVANLNEIAVEEGRQRTEFKAGAIEALAESIAKHGLIHAPTVRDNEEGGYFLVSGERRLRAIQMLNEQGRKFKHGITVYENGLLPCLPQGYINELTSKEIELEENVQRVDLSWQEKNQAVADLHALRLIQTDGAQTLQATAAEIFGKPAEDRNLEKEPLRKHERVVDDKIINTSDGNRISKATIIAEYLDDPDVKKARNESDAWRIVLSKLETQVFSGDMLKEEEEEQDNNRVLYVGDMQKILPTIPDASCHLLITDPPYGVGVAKFGDAAKLEHKYEEENFEELHETLLKEAARILTPDCHIYIFCDLDYFHQLRELVAKYGFKPRRVPLIWSKGTAGHLDGGSVLGFRRSYECVLYATRGERPCNRLFTDVFYINTLTETDRFHAAQKPTRLYSEFIRQSALPGETVLDPFAGSGTIFAAAKFENCRAIGIEQNKEMAALVAARREVRTVK